MVAALDATPLTLTSGGLKRYAVELSRALAAEFPSDIFYLASDQPFVPPRDLPNLRRARRPRNWIERRWWSCGLNRELARVQADAFHGTNFEVPYLPLRASVVTVHDLSPWREPDGGRVHRRAAALIRFGIATLVITPTEATRRETIEFFDLHPARVVAVPEAAAAHLRPVLCGSVQRPYFLYVGALEPRKNVGVLLDAWRAVHAECGVGLVLAGKPRPGFPVPAREPGLRVAGEVAEDDLAALYSGAVALVYPSLYEGFGLPVLEAMQCGAPVIASRTPAIAEVAGGAALLLDPCDPRAWAEALRAVATTPELAASLRERGLEWAREFSWEHTARRTREVYVEAIARFRG